MRKYLFAFVALLLCLTQTWSQTAPVNPNTGVPYKKGDTFRATDLNTLMTKKSDFPVVISGATVTGTPAVGYVPVASSPTAAAWGPFTDFPVSAGTVWRRPSTSSLNAIPYTAIVNEGTFIGTGVGGANYFDSVVSQGWNIGQTIETPAVAGVAVNFDTWESKFHLPGSGNYQIERHFGLVDTSNVVHRYMSFQAPWNGVGAVGGAGSSAAIGSFQVDSLNFNSWAGTQVLVMNLTGNVMNVNNGFSFFVSNNNTGTFRQSNAAANAFLQLPYINASDQTQVDQPLNVGKVGGTSGAIALLGSTSGNTTLSASATGVLQVNGTPVLSVTKTVRAAGGASDCTLIFTAGLLTGGSC